MAGLIWFVQRVHYPLMSCVHAEAFTDFERSHMKRTTPVVATLMLLEAASAAWLLHRDPASPQLLVATVLLVFAWVWTFAVMVPLHERLARGFDAITHRRLVALNWPRTIAWSLRAIIAIWITAQTLITRPSV